jgi:hypothetical protein
MSIYSKTLSDGGIGPNAPTAGAKLAYAICTALHALEPNAASTDPSSAQSVINRLAALGVSEHSTAMRALKFDLNSVIERQRQ